MILTCKIVFLVVNASLHLLNNVSGLYLIRCGGFCHIFVYYVPVPMSSNLHILFDSFVL
jgi:hypothetical protein